MGGKPSSGASKKHCSCLHGIRLNIAHNQVLNIAHGRLIYYYIPFKKGSGVMYILLSPPPPFVVTATSGTWCTCSKQVHCWWNLIWSLRALHSFFLLCSLFECTPSCNPWLWVLACVFMTVVFTVVNTCTPLSHTLTTHTHTHTHTQTNTHTHTHTHTHLFFYTTSYYVFQYTNTKHDHLVYVIFPAMII